MSEFSMPINVNGNHQPDNKDSNVMFDGLNEEQMWDILSKIVPELTRAQYIKIWENITNNRELQ